MGRRGANGGRRFPKPEKVPPKIGCGRATGGVGLGPTGTGPTGPTGIGGGCGVPLSGGPPVIGIGRRRKFPACGLMVEPISKLITFSPLRRR